MVVEDSGVLADPARLAAVDRALRVMAALPVPLAGIAQVAARLSDAPMGVITLVGVEQEHLAGSYGTPAALVADGCIPEAYSVCKYVVSGDAPVACENMRTDPEKQLREHPLTREYGIRAFLGIPLRDATGRPVGSLTVLDTRARPWTDAHRSALTELAVLVDQVPATVPEIGTALLAELDTMEVLDSLAEAFLTLSPAGVITGWNAAARDMFGFTVAEACGQPVAELFDAHYNGRPVPDVLGALLAGDGETITGTAVLRHRDGRAVHARVRMSTLHGPGGSAVVCVFLTDITDQVDAAETARAAAAKADNAVDAQRGFAEALLDSLGEGVIAVNEEGRAVVFNRALRALHAIPAELPLDAAHAVALTQLHRPDGEPMGPDTRVLEKAQQGGTTRESETLIRVPGHPDRHVVASAQPIRTSDGRRIGAVTTVQDVTDRRRAERFRDCQLAVAKILNQPRSLTDLAQDVLRLVGQTLSWPYLSLRLSEPATDTLYRIAQWHPEDYDLDEILPARMPRDADTIPTQVWATGEPIWEPDLASSHWITDPDSRDRAHVFAERGLRSVLSVPVRDGEDVLGVLTCFADTVEHDEFLLTGLLGDVAAQIAQFLIRRHAEELAAELSRARADFTALIGHDMRTPLTTIGTYIQFLLEDPGPRPDTERQLLEGIDRNSQALRELVEGLLDLTALECDDQPLATHHVDLCALITDATAAALPAATATGIRLHTTLPHQVHVNGDRDRLRQLIDKLLTTTITGNPGGGDVHLILDRATDTARLTITDPGGLDLPDEAFERFSQANTTGTGNTTSGLGFVLSRAIAERHGGTLTVTKTAQTITTTVHLPLP
ncbi:PAS domain-containing protein [Cryptosporangium aurantiacum]|uniref:histidine kinase n=1 Tax=Cryptosporangium aurantiacum TaxID=134849 RepID=A0A1M7PBR7_9ACTN|nr:PAS domain-containing protein [Cryptosporangium aurantiacum]SHN14277.1 PAS domain S-box-containing protein [Cryptosporangium aurantiacum]